MQCRSDYNVFDIEQKLLDIIASHLLRWQLQDLKCSFCKQITQMNMKEHCTCSRNLATEFETGDEVSKVLVYNKIARYYDMKLLEEFTASIMESNEVTE